MSSFVNVIRTIFPFLQFFWMGGRNVCVTRPVVEYDPRTGETNRYLEEVGYLVKLPHGPCWLAVEIDDNDQWIWQSRISYSLPAALVELFKHDGSNVDLDPESRASCINAEEDLLSQEQAAVAA